MKNHFLLRTLIRIPDYCHQEALMHFTDQIFSIDSAVVKIQNGLTCIANSLTMHLDREPIRSRRTMMKRKRLNTEL